MNVVVILLSFNHFELTSRCLVSLRKFFFDINILLVHNGSSHEIVEKLKADFPHVQHLLMSANRGYAGGMNFGLTYFLNHYQEPWCFLVTNDTELLEFDEKVLQTATHIIAPQIYFRSLQKLDAWGGYYDSYNGRLYHYRDLSSHETDFMWDSFYIPGTAMLLNRSVLLKNLFFEESICIFWEDVYFSFKAKNMSFELSRTNLVKLKHGGGKTTKKDARYTSYYYQRNRLIISPRLEKSIIKRKIIQCNIVKDILVLLFQKMVKGDFIRGKNLFLALIDAFFIKRDLR